MKNHRKLKIAGIIALLLVGLYGLAVFSNIPFIKKWRTIYIETAMSTMTHQWLATAFIPSSVVNDVMEDVWAQQEANLIESNSLIEPESATLWLGYPLGISDEVLAERNFFENYSEVDMSTLPKDLTYDGLVLTDIEGMKTIQGDKILVIDTVNEFILLDIVGDGYVGKMAIIKDPSKVELAVSSKQYTGQHLVDIVNEADGILGINASGFYDPNGKGNGGTPVGLVKSNGTLIQKQLTLSNWFNAGFDYQNNLRIGNKVDESELRDGVQFKPAIIIDGEKRVEGSAGWGIQPRSCIGQTSRKEVLFLVIDGRKPGYSIGATVGNCADELLKYGAVQGINLDGGSSSTFVYNGETINKTSTSGGNKDGRYIPNAWVLKRSDQTNNKQVKAS